MRTAPGPIVAALQTDAFALAQLVHLTLADGSVIGLTDWNRALSVDLFGDGAVTYRPGAMAGLTAFSAQINSPIDDSELRVIIDGSTFTADAVRRGAFDSCLVRVGYVLPSDLANPWFHRIYDVGQAKIEGLTISLELLGPEKRLEAPVGRAITVNCPWSFGDPDCGLATRVNAWAATTAYGLGAEVMRATGTGIYWFRATAAGTSGGSEPTWPGTLGGTASDGTVTWTAFRARRLTGTVTGSSGRRNIQASGISVVANWFTEGFVTWLTGANAGDVRRVKNDTGAGVLTLHLSAFEDISAGDTFTVVAGCRKRFEQDCIASHDNAARFGGFPFLAPEEVTATAPRGPAEA